MGNIKRDDYFKDLKVYSRKISNIIYKEFDNIPIAEHVNFFNKKRKHKPYQRPFLFKIVISLFEKTQIEKELVDLIGAYIEILNISTYLSNHAFDEKNSINSKLKSNNQVIASILLRDFLDKQLKKLETLTVQQKLLLIERFSEINYLIYIGQYLDTNKLLIENFKKYKNYEHYLKEYEKRCYLITGAFQEKIVDIASILTKDDDYSVILKNFSKYLGIGIQIVNDIGDFVVDFDGAIDTHKDHQDYFADIRNGKLTLPIYLALQNNTLKNEIIKLSKEDTYGIIQYRKIAGLMYQENVFKEAKKLALKYYDLANNELSKLPDSIEKQYLKHMLLLLKVNKYYTTLRMKYDTNNT